MLNKTENAEREYFESVKEKLQAALSQIDMHVRQHSRELQEQKKYIWENKAEKGSMQQSIYQSAFSGEATVAKKNRLRKLMASPYFGRIDFGEDGAQAHVPVYIGVHAFFDETANTNLIYDWRAPVSSMFYDFETGPAYFESPSGRITGEISLKRQYRIRDASMDFMLENSLNIHDEVLQKELSRSSDEKMKNIVATIQQDQNAIIRNETSPVLIIQGVAGSGKTSIALHRIAFLLYRFKDTITAKNILIISPNKVFADYISNVLPELGEEKIPETGIDTLADELLEGKYAFQTFFEQVAMLLENKDEAVLQRIQFKSSFEFLHLLNQYITYVSNEYFRAADLLVKRYTVPAWFIMQRFEACHRLPLLKRFIQMTKDIVEHVQFKHQYTLSTSEKNDIRKAVTKMLKVNTLRELYKDFYAWAGKPAFFKPASRATLEYADVFPLLYMKIRLEGVQTYSQVKHLLVDEMQDYTPVQYAVLSKLFGCKKTILGDADQSVNPYSSSTAELIQRSFPESVCMKLYKSYRSTLEIIHFAQHISQNKNLIAIERHGEVPTVVGIEDEIAEIRKLIAGFNDSDYHSLGIICKTQKQAEWLSEQLPSANLLTAQSTTFSEGITITTAHLAKGLEFDQVIVPFASAENYHSEIDKSMLYVACTRAMHKLDVIYSGTLTSFIEKTAGA